MMSFLNIKNVLKKYLKYHSFLVKNAIKHMLCFEQNIM